MTTNNLHVLARTKPLSRLLVADRDPSESAIVVRAIRRRYPGLEIGSVTTLAAAAAILARERIETVLAGSGLDGGTLPQTIAWFARNAPDASIIALLEQTDDPNRKEALDAGARHVCSKPDLLVAQLRYELGSRLSAFDPEPRRFAPWSWSA